MSQSEREDAVEATLSAIHEAITADHADARARLLEKLPPSVDAPAEAGGWRFAVASAALAAAALLVWVALPPSISAAVERVAQAVDQVASYSYRMKETYVSTAGDGRTVETVFEGWWRRDPIGMSATTEIWITAATNTDTPGPREKTCDLLEVHQAGERGVLVDHLRRHFWRCDPIDKNAFGGGSPTAIIYKVRKQRGRVLSDLGEKEINGRTARGVEILLDDSAPETDVGPAIPQSPEGQARGWDWRNVRVELWYDPETNLPTEFQTVRRGDDFTTTIRYTDLQWNVEFPPRTFEPRSPEGYEELPQSPYADDE